MKKWILTIILMLILVSTATALQDLCDDKVEIQTNCTMVTPTVSCDTYNYSIINVTDGNYVEVANLTQLNNEIYYFNFTQPEGGYVVLLCDDTTREVQVTGEDEAKMIIAMIILLPFLLGLFFIIGAATLDNKHSVLKITLFLLSIPTIWVSFHWASIGLNNYAPSLTSLINAMADTTQWLGYVYVVIIVYFLIHSIAVMFRTAAQKKDERIEY